MLRSLQKQLGEGSLLRQTAQLPPFQLTQVRHATKRTSGSGKNTSDSAGRRLGAKKTDGQEVWGGCILMRQRGTQWYPGENVRLDAASQLSANRWAWAVIIQSMPWSTAMSVSIVIPSSRSAGLSAWCTTEARDCRAPPMLSGLDDSTSRSCLRVPCRPRWRRSTRSKFAGDRQVLRRPMKRPRLHRPRHSCFLKSKARFERRPTFL